jgi:hypothetical protein
MTSTITTAVTFCFIIAGVWAVNLVSYHPSTGSVDPTAPINVTVAWK